MGKLVLLFTEGLVQPLKVLFKPQNPTNSNDAMTLTRDLENVLPRIRFPPKPNFKFESNPSKRQKDAPDTNFQKKYTF